MSLRRERREPCELGRGEVPQLPLQLFRSHVCLSPLVCDAGLSFGAAALTCHPSNGGADSAAPTIRTRGLGPRVRLQRPVDTLEFSRTAVRNRLGGADHQDARARPARPSAMTGRAFGHSETTSESVPRTRPKTTWRKVSWAKTRRLQSGGRWRSPRRGCFRSARIASG